MKLSKISIACCLLISSASFADGNPFDYKTERSGKIVEIKGLNGKVVKITASEKARKKVLESKPLKIEKEPIKISESAEYKSPPKLQEGELAMSDVDVNRLIFEHPVVQAIFPTDVSKEYMARQPIYLANNKEVALQFKPGLDRSIQGIFELENGEVKTLYFRILPVKGSTHRVKSQNSKDISKEVGITRSGNESNQVQVDLTKGEIGIHKALVEGKIPEGFYEIKPYPSLQFDRYTVQSVKSYEGLGKKVHLYKIISRAGLVSTITPPMFNRDGVTSIMVDGDQVSAKLSPLVIVIEDSKEQ